MYPRRINPFHTTCLFLYPLKTSENLQFPDVLRGYRKTPVTGNGLKPVQQKATEHHQQRHKSNESL